MESPLIAFKRYKPLVSWPTASGTSLYSAAGAAYAQITPSIIGPKGDMGPS